jgi:hypothetical protein
MITAHTFVKNEENFIWYAINSIIDHVDQIFVWDQGSNDKTKQIIKSINNSKIKFREMPGDVAKVREKMLKETKEGWIFILDGDEVWYQDAISKLRNSLEQIGDSKDYVVVPNYMLIGDIFHYQEEKAGGYKIGGKVGHYNIRAIRKTPGLHVEGIYPNEAYVTKEGVKVQDLNKERMLFLNEPYLHASFLKRFSKDRKKIKYEIGESFPKDFYFPEVFFKTRPDIVPSPWRNMDLNYKLRAFWQTPLKKIKRRII